MICDAYNSLSPEGKAREDYRAEGLGQDANPYDKKTQFELWDRYAWEMHRIWAGNFRDDLDQARAQREHEHV